MFYILAYLQKPKTDFPVFPGDCEWSSHHHLQLLVSILTEHHLSTPYHMLKNAGSKVSTISDNSSNRKVLEGEGEGEEKLQFYMYLLRNLIRNLGPAALLRCGKM